MTIENLAEKALLDRCKIPVGYDNWDTAKATEGMRSALNKMLDRLIVHYTQGPASPPLFAVSGLEHSGKTRVVCRLLMMAIQSRRESRYSTLSEFLDANRNGFLDREEYGDLFLSPRYLVIDNSLVGYLSPHEQRAYEHLVYERLRLGKITIIVLSGDVKIVPDAIRNRFTDQINIA